MDGSTAYFARTVSYNCKVFMKLTPAANAIKLFVCNLQILVLSLRVCSNRLEKLARDKHSRLWRKSVNYGQQRFYKIGHRADQYSCLLMRHMNGWAK